MILDKLTFTINKAVHYVAHVFDWNHGFKLLGVGFFWLMSQMFDPGMFKEVFVSIMILPVIDYITGIMAAHKRGEKVESRGFYGSVVKIATYALMVAACRMAESPVPELSALDNLAIKAIAVTEIWSVIENFDKMGYVRSKKLKELIRGVSK